MANRQFTDQWLIPTVSDLLGKEKVDELLAAESAKEKDAKDSVWETLVSSGAATDDQVLEALSKRFRYKVTDCAVIDRAGKDIVPESFAKKYRILPLRVTDSYLEIAASNPFDLDCEKALAFSTGREVRVQLASPAKIREKTEELYRPENVIDKLLGR